MSYKDSKIVVLKSKLEKISKAKDDLETKIAKFENASQSLDKLIGSRITDNSKKGLGYVSYNAVPPPHTRRFSPSRIDLSHTGLSEFAEQGSDEEDEVKSPPEKDRKNVKPSVDKARCKYHQRERMVNETNHSRVNHNANTVPEAMLTRTGLKPVNSVRPVNPKRNFQRRASYDNRKFFKNINTTKEKVNTARPNSAVLNAVRENKGKAGHSHKHIEDQVYFDSGCSWHMIGNNPTSLTSKSLMEGDAHHIWLSLILDKRMIKYELSNGLKTRTRIGRIGIRIPQSNVPSSAADEAITIEMHNGLGRATTTTSSLVVEQSSGNISKTQTKATPSGKSSLRTSSEGSPGCHFTIEYSPIQARPERLSNLPNEPPLREGNTSQSEEGSIQLLELMEICTKLSNKVIHLKNELTSTKVCHNKALITLTKRVKKLEKKLKHKRRRAVLGSSEEEEASLDYEDSPKQGMMIKEIDKDDNVNLVKSSEQEKAHIQADEDLAERMLEEERESLSIKERSRLLAEIIDKRKKMMAAKRVEKKRNKPPTQAQQRTFVPMKSEGQAGEGSLKEGKNLKRSAEEELGQEQKVEEEIAHQEDVVAKQAEKQSSKKARERLKRKTSKSR
nr:hypothetical protein [Tanacetum cinerariifolium]